MKSSLISLCRTIKLNFLFVFVLVLCAKMCFLLLDTRYSNFFAYRKTMVAKSHVIVIVFVGVIAAYIAVMFTRYVKAAKKTEMFEDSPKLAGNVAEDQLEKNLFIINTFEEVQGKKITTDDLKYLTKAWSDKPAMTKDEMKTFITKYKKEAFAEQDGTILEELDDALQQLVNIVKRLKEKPSKPAAVKPAVEAAKKVDPEHFFQGVLPFSNERKFVTVM